MDVIYSEKKLAEIIGISHALMRKARKEHLETGDYGLTRYGNRQVMAYTQEAGHKILEKLAHKAPALILGRDVPTILILADVRPHGPPKPPGNILYQPAPPNQKLLSAPWLCPAAEFIEPEPTGNIKILLAKLAPEWVKENGFDYYNRILWPILTDKERQQDNLFETKKFRIRVNSNINFTLKMRVKAEWIQQDLWECTQRMPRWRGTW